MSARAEYAAGVVSAPLVMRGDTMLDDVEGALRSELDGVPDENWTQFVRAMIVQKVGDVSKSNAVGMFAIMPRRLADLGVVRRLGRGKKSGKSMWVAEFVPPLTCEIFLSNPKAQYRVFTKSMKDYVGKMRSGEIKRDPSMTTSGALAILHRAGPRGLETWASGERFEATQKSYERAQGLF